MSIRGSRRFLKIRLPDAMLLFALGFALFASLIFFWTLRGSEGLSPNAQHWSYFGDYIGGVVGPVVALFALWALVYAIKLQRKELDSALQELALSREAFQKQVDHFLAETHIADLRAALNHLESQLDECLSQKIRVSLNPEYSRDYALRDAIFDSKVGLLGRIPMSEMHRTRQLDSGRSHIFNEVVSACILFNFLAKLLYQVEAVHKQGSLALAVKIKYSKVVCRLHELNYFHGSTPLYLMQLMDFPDPEIQEKVPLVVT